jgi:hypothetical protein
MESLLYPESVPDSFTLISLVASDMDLSLMSSTFRVSCRPMCTVSIRYYGLTTRLADVAAQIDVI